MDADDIRKERCLERSFGPARFCVCGARLGGTVNGDPRADEPVDYPYLCSACRQGQVKTAMLFDVEGPRPRKTAFEDPNQFVNAKSHWLGYRQPHFWKPARERNRCWCGGRSCDPLNRICINCRTIQRKNQLHDQVNFMNDKAEAERLARIWEMEDFLKELVALGPCWTTSPRPFTRNGQSAGSRGDIQPRREYNPEGLGGLEG